MIITTWMCDWERQGSLKSRTKDPTFCKLTTPAFPQLHCFPSPPEHITTPLQSPKPIRSIKIHIFRNPDLSKLTNFQIRLNCLFRYQSKNWDFTYISCSDEYVWCRERNEMRGEPEGSMVMEDDLLRSPFFHGPRKVCSFFSLLVSLNFLFIYLFFLLFRLNY